MRNPPDGGTLYAMMLRERVPVRFGLAIAVLAGLAGLNACEQNTTDKDISRISVSELARLDADAMKRSGRSGLLIIDPRSAADFEAGHIPGAVNLRIADFATAEETNARLKRYSNIVVYGEDPASPSARGMTKRLLSSGIDAKMLDGGLLAWRQSGGEMATGK